MRWLRLSAISEPVVRVHFVAEATVGRQGRAINRSHQMTVPRTAADVLDDHVTFELECIDRLYLNLYQPKLQHELGVVGFFKGHRGFQFVTTALMGSCPSAAPRRRPRRFGPRRPADSFQRKTNDYSRSLIRVGVGAGVVRPALARLWGFA